MHVHESRQDHISEQYCIKFDEHQLGEFVRMLVELHSSLNDCNSFWLPMICIQDHPLS